MFIGLGPPITILIPCPCTVDLDYPDHSARPRRPQQRRHIDNDRHSYDAPTATPTQRVAARALHGASQKNELTDLDLRWGGHLRSCTSAGAILSTWRLATTERPHRTISTITGRPGAMYGNINDITHAQGRTARGDCSAFDCDRRKSPYTVKTAGGRSNCKDQRVRGGDQPGRRLDVDASSNGVCFASAVQGRMEPRQTSGSSCWRVGGLIAGQNGKRNGRRDEQRIPRNSTTRGNHQSFRGLLRDDDHGEQKRNGCLRRLRIVCGCDAAYKLVIVATHLLRLRQQPRTPTATATPDRNRGGNDQCGVSTIAPSSA